MLDPIKVSILTPGVADKGGLDKRGIPASLVTKYLQHSRRRGREDDRLYGPGPVLDGHHQGQVGHAPQRPARFQARLRQQRTVGAGAAPARRRLSGHLWQPRVARPRRPDVCAVARLAADALAGRGVFDPAETGHDAERGLSAPGARRDRARAARQAGQPGPRHQRRAVPAGNSDAHAGRIHGSQGWPLPRLSQGPGVLGQAVPRIRARYPRHRAPRRRPVRAVPEGGCRRAHERNPAARCR